MDRIYYIRHREKKILYLDGSNVNFEEALPLIREAKEFIRSQPEKSLLTLTDLTNARFNDHVTQSLKEYVAGNKPYVIAAAVIGVTGLKQILLNSILKLSGRKLTLCDTKEQALDWLAGQ